MTFSEDLSRRGQRAGLNMADLIMRILYTYGPPVMVLGALAGVGVLAYEEGAWQAFRGFTAFFIPVVLGAYVLRRWPDWLRRRLRVSDKLLTLFVPFVIVLVLGGSLAGEFNATRWIIGLAFIGLLIAVLFMVRIVDRPSGEEPYSAEINLAALDIIVGTITAAGVLVLFRT